jgi:benzylsuccinate CoA-transferase BbsF subunit
MTGGVLGDVRVLDFTWFGVGPITTKYLADNGATVVKVESMARPDGLRLAPPWKDATPGINNSQFYASYNSSKKSITVNLGEAEGRELIRRLVPHFDVVAESFTPNTMAEWGLAYDDLSALRPDLIMLSTCMQGQTGPHAHYPGFGNLMASLSGFYYLAGYSEAEIAPPYGAYTDFIGPRFGASALLGAIDHRRRTGVGQHIDMAQYEVALHFLAPAVADYFATGRVMAPRANRSERYAPHGAYRVADLNGEEQWVALAVETDEEWAGLVGVLGAGEAEGATTGRWAGARSRIEAGDELDGWVQERVAARSGPELVARLQAAGVAAYPVQSCLDLHSDDNLNSFGFWQWLEMEDVGVMPYEGCSYRLDRTPGTQTAAPVIGRHTDEIFRELLGLTPVEIEQLREERVIY